MAKKKKKSGLKKLLIAGAILVLIGGIVSSYVAYTTIYKPNVNLKGKKSTYIYIPTGANFETVKSLLYTANLIDNA